MQNHMMQLKKQVFTPLLYQYAATWFTPEARATANMAGSICKSHVILYDQSHAQHTQIMLT